MVGLFRDYGLGFWDKGLKIRVYQGREEGLRRTQLSRLKGGRVQGIIILWG